MPAHEEANWPRAHCVAGAPCPGLRDQRSEISKVRASDHVVGVRPTAPSSLPLTVGLEAGAGLMAHVVLPQETVEVAVEDEEEAMGGGVLAGVTGAVKSPYLLGIILFMFLFTFTSFGVVRVLGTADRTTIEVEVWRRATQLGDIGGARQPILMAGSQHLQPGHRGFIGTGFPSSTGRRSGSHRFPR